MIANNFKKKYKLRKNDEVQVISGKEQGKSGRLLRIDRIKDRIYLEGLNLVKKAKRKRSQNDQSGIIEIEGSIHISNVKLLCKNCGPVRVGYRYENNEKQRYCKKCGEVV